jgi:hypothetical protein
MKDLMRNRKEPYQFGLLFKAALVPVLISPKFQMVCAADAKQAQGEKSFTISVPKNVSVELVGICSSPREGRQWWRPDGTPFEKKPCDGWSSSYMVRWAKDRNPERKRYEVAVRITHEGSERATAEWRFAKGRQSHLDIGHRPAPDIHSVLIEDSANDSVIDFKMAVATGTWETDCTYASAGYRVDVAARESAGYAVIWMRPTVPEENYPGRTKLSVIHDFTGEYKTRILLADTSGQVHRPLQTKSNRVKNLTVFRGYYDSPVEVIEEFRLQIRPLYWIRFRNVSLKPGLKTNSKIELSKSAEGSEE